MHLLRVICCGFVALLIGCGGDGPLSIREVRELQAARARWLSSSVRNAYTVEVRVSCFCPDEYARWNTVTVVNDSIVDVRVTATGVQPARRWWSGYLTIERMFQTFNATDEGYLVDIRARFDPQYGYPLEVETRYSPEIADGGGALYAHNLRPASGNP